MKINSKAEDVLAKSLEFIDKVYKDRFLRFLDVEGCFAKRHILFVRINNRLAVVPDSIRPDAFRTFIICCKSLFSHSGYCPDRRRVIWKDSEDEYAYLDIKINSDVYLSTSIIIKSREITIRVSDDKDAMIIPMVFDISSKDFKGIHKLDQFKKYFRLLA